MTELDPSLNLLPPAFESGLAGRRVHLIGIGGVAMTPLAGLLSDAGAIVSGSDGDLYPPMSTLLEGMGLKLYKGYGPDSLPGDCDLVVVGNVVTRAFPVLERLAALKKPYLSLPQALGRIFMKGGHNLVVAGCHGKTSTTAMCAHLWSQAGLKPGFLIGGSSLDFPKPWNLGEGGTFIIEGDEYDSAFFNKVPKFVHYRPHTVILTSVEFDHADIYPDLEAVKEAYRSLVRLIPAEGGLLLACGDDPLAREVAEACPGRVEFYGQDERNDWQLASYSPDGFGSVFEVCGPDYFYTRLSLGHPGVYNALNSLAATAAFVSLGGDGRRLASAVENFRGVKRRQEILGDFNGITLVDDFAHHPSAVEKTISGFREAFPGRRLLVAFEPRSNTSRRAIFQSDYARALAGADLVFLRRPSQPEKAPEGDRLDARRLADDLAPKAFLFDDGAALGEALAGKAEAGDVVVVMSNGGFDGLTDYLKDKLANR